LVIIDQNNGHFA